jgi:hypothetical protein
MKPRQWMQIAAVASAIGLTGNAIAHDMDRTPASSDNPSATANSAAQLGGSAANPTPGALPDNGMNSSNGSTSTLNSDNDSTSTLNSDNAQTQNLNGNVNGDTSTSNDNTSNLNRDSTTTDVNGGTALDNGATGTTQGSTMTSPRSDTSANGPTGGARYGSGSDATTIGGSNRLGSTNSGNFNPGMSDYTSQHPGNYSSPARTGSDVQPDDMGPGNVRGQ